jgi:hypothetical protein
VYAPTNATVRTAADRGTVDGEHVFDHERDATGPREE